MKKAKKVSGEAALRLVIEGTVSETGKDFFKSLVQNLAKALGTLAAWVTEYLPEEKKLRAYAMWCSGGFVDHYEYQIQGTACQSVIENQRLIHIPERLIELFPHDDDLVPLKAVSYLGAPILDVDGSIMGHLGILDDKPMPPDREAIALFEVFTARAAGEMRRLKTEQAVRSREQQLSQLLASTMDAIIVLDHELVISQVNPAAERLFACTPEDLIGESIRDFLVQGSALQLETVAGNLANRPVGQQQLWVPHDIVARRWDHSVFPAEVTISRFEAHQGTFFTLILRNADERLEAERQIKLLTQEAEYLREVARDTSSESGLVGQSTAMKAVTEAIRQVARTDSTVLICGETGTGKERVARSIHQSSLRSDKPLIFVNCAAIPANLIESEFFGHEKGAFTGAVERRQGRFALADGGTIFLDEVGELPLELQAKLLRVLQEGTFEPLGSSKSIRVNVRVVAATNRQLRKMISERLFREDLYFRLNVFPISLPPLRERGRDVELLADVFLKRFSRQMGKRIEALSERQRTCLRQYDWPGNVRELMNVIERAVILTNGPALSLDRAMAGFVNCPAEGQEETSPMNRPARVLTARDMENAERDNLIRALELTGWKVSGETGAARLLGLPPTTLSSRMKKLAIRRPVA